MSLLRSNRLEYTVGIVVAMMTFFLTGCSVNNSTEQQTSHIEATAEAGEDSSIIQAIEDPYHSQVQKQYDGSSDEMVTFYVDPVEGLASSEFGMNTRTGTVVDGATGKPLNNMKVDSAANLAELSADEYKAAIEAMVVPLIKGKGYTYDGKWEDHFVAFAGDGYIEYEVYKNHLSYSILVEPFTKEVKEMEEETALNPDTEPLELTPAQEKEAPTLQQLRNKGFTIIEDQSFQLNLQYWGEVRFVSGYYMKNTIKQPKFYIVNQDQLVLYTLPDKFSSNLNLTSIKAVSFRDVNGDGQRDIMIIGQYKPKNTATYTEPEPLSTIASVYFFAGDSYIQLPWYDQYVNKSGNNSTIAALVKEGDALFRQVAGPQPEEGRGRPVSLDRIDRMAPLICSKELLDSGDLSYAALPESLAVFADSSTSTESYLVNRIADCFARDSKTVSSGQNTPAAPPYEKLLMDIMNDIVIYTHIKSGGDSVWSIVHAYSMLEVQVTLNKYMKENDLNDHDHIRSSISSLSKDWNKLDDEMKAVIRDKTFGEDHSTVLKAENLNEIITLERRLDANMNDLIGLAAKDKKADIFIDLIKESLK